MADQLQNTMHTQKYVEYVVINAVRQSTRVMINISNGDQAHLQLLSAYFSLNQKGLNRLLGLIFQTDDY
jgi:hypothetical protein